MLFNSYEYILLFLPVSVCIYHFSRRHFRNSIATMVLTTMSLAFYSYHNYIYLYVLVGSIIINYLTGLYLCKKKQCVYRKYILFGIVFANLLVLLICKIIVYDSDLASRVSGVVLGASIPIGVSFFIFQQIAYLVDCYRARVKEGGLLSYGLFVCFFPQLIAGPIVHHSEMMPQFSDKADRGICYEKMFRGLALLAIGLGKKVLLADSLAPYANQLFDSAAPTGMLQAWVGGIAYTFQLYFDFSGYTDMALGSALMFNVSLPENFNSPYKALSIRDFWRRWHITLSRFLREYVYIPLGGNRFGTIPTAVNLSATFLLGGIWHGIGWTYVLWGAFHGGGMIIHRAWRATGRTMPLYAAWPVTFLFVSAGWVLFRATSVESSFHIYKAALTLPISFDELRVGFTEAGGGFVLFLLTVSAFICFCCPNSMRLLDRINSSWVFVAATVSLLVASVLSIASEVPFIYFQF